MNGITEPGRHLHVPTADAFPTIWHHSPGSASDHAVHAFLFDWDVAVEQHVRLTEQTADALANLTVTNLDLIAEPTSHPSPDTPRQPCPAFRTRSLDCPGAPQNRTHANLTGRAGRSR